MSREEILAKVKAELVSEFEIPAEKITPEARFFEDLDLDSIDAVDLIVRLRNEWNFEVSAEEFKAIRTVDDLLAVLEKLLAAQQG